MRTTLDIHDDLMRQAKAAALDSGRTLTSIVEDSLRMYLARRNGAESGKAAIVLPTFGGGGLMPGVDLDNSASLLDIMEEGDAPF